MYTSPEADPAAADSSPADEELPQRLFTFKHDAALPDAGPPAAVGSASPGQPLTISAETEPGQEAHLTIVACGQPHKESDTSIKIPLIFKISDSDKECMVNLVINFDNFTMREPR